MEIQNRGKLFTREQARTFLKEGFKDFLQEALEAQSLKTSLAIQNTIGKTKKHNKNEIGAPPLWGASGFLLKPVNHR